MDFTVFNFRFRFPNEKKDNARQAEQKSSVVGDPRRSDRQLKWTGMFMSVA